jgi:hypothetical protein
MQKSNPKKKRKVTPEPAPTDPMNSSGDEQRFEVERILKRKYNKAKKQWLFLVRWGGFGEEEDTWEPRESLDACEGILSAFLATQGKGSTASSSSASVEVAVHPASAVPKVERVSHGNSLVVVLYLIV